METRTKSTVIDGEIFSKDEELMHAHAQATGMVRAALGNEVRQALVDRVQREAMRMVPSLAKEMAKNGLQADLEVFRISQAQRVGTETLVTATRAIVRNNAYAEQLMRENPSVAVEIAEMVCAQNELMKQMPTIATTAYLHRYYNR